MFKKYNYDLRLYSSKRVTTIFNLFLPFPTYNEITPDGFENIWEEIWKMPLNDEYVCQVQKCAFSSIPNIFRS